jgi:hypothetical protein
LSGFLRGANQAERLREYTGSGDLESQDGVVRQRIDFPHLRAGCIGNGLKVQS